MKTFAVSAVVVLAGAANAQQTQTAMQSYMGNPDFDQALSFDLFDTQGGLRILESVCITLDLEASGGQLIVDNDGVDPASVDVELATMASISSLDVFINQAIEADVSFMDSFVLAGDDGDANPGGVEDVNPNGPDAAVLAGGNGMDSAMVELTGAAAASFVGMGTFDLVVSASQLLDFGGNGAVSGGFTPTTASGVVTLQYKFRVIPAPASAAILGLGGLVAIRRR